MTLISAIYKELVMGGHMLAIGTASIAAVSAILLGGGLTFVLLLMAYLFSYGAYMINRGSEIEEDAISNPGRTGYLAGRRRYLPLIAGACFGIGYLLAALTNLIFLIALLIPLFLSLLYSVGSKRLVSVLGVRRLKEKLLVKNVSISFGWSLIPLLVGLYYQNFSLPLLLLVPFIFQRLMVNTLLFDIRDLEGDRANGIRTLPIALGKKPAFQVMGAIDLVSAAYLVGLLISGSFPLYSLVLILLPAYSLINRWVASKGWANMNFLCDVVADGEYVLWGPLIYLGRILI